MKIFAIAAIAATAFAQDIIDMSEGAADMPDFTVAEDEMMAEVETMEEDGDWKDDMMEWDEKDTTEQIDMLRDLVDMFCMGHGKDDDEDHDSMDEDWEDEDDMDDEGRRLQDETEAAMDDEMDMEESDDDDKMTWDEARDIAMDLGISAEDLDNAETRAEDLCRQVHKMLDEAEAFHNDDDEGKQERVEDYVDAISEFFGGMFDSATTLTAGAAAVAILATTF